jgi:hypothetical protein
VVYGFDRAMDHRLVDHLAHAVGYGLDCCPDTSRAASCYVSVFAIWLVLWYVYGNFSMLGMLLADSVDQPRFRLYLAMYLAPEFLTIVGLMVGGLLGARPTQSLSASADLRRQ